MAACLSLFGLRSSKKPQVVRCPPNEQASLALARQQTNNGFGWLWHVPSSFRVYGAQVHAGPVLHYHPGNRRKGEFHMETRFPSLQTDVSTLRGGSHWIVFFYQPEALADFLEQHEVDTSWLGLKTWRKPCSRMWRRQYRRAQRLANLQAV